VGFINKESFKRLFGFGSKLMITGLLDTVYNNIYNLIIGKFFSPATLGFYNRAYTFSGQTASGISIALQQVTYPILSKTRDEPERLKSAYRKIVMSITFINFPIIAGLALIAGPLIEVLLGEKWMPVVPYLQVLCLSAFVGHLSSINQNLLKVLGRSDLFLKISLINKGLATIAIIIGLQFGIWGLLIGSVISQYLAVYISMYYTSKFISYPFIEQINDVLPIAIVLLPMLLVLWIFMKLGTAFPIIQLSSMVIIGAAIYFLTAYLCKSTALSQINELIQTYIRNRGNST
jgi:O-antigen/teichoic acid export membrane protein